MRMCKQCLYQFSLDGTCQDGASISEQNQKAKSRRCDRAAIQGGTFGFSDHDFDTVLGDMIHLKNGDWVFEGRFYSRSDETGKPQSRGKFEPNLKF